MAYRTFETDVLVVGGGGVGFRAAIGARERGARVMLLSKGPLARCGASPMAGADFTKIQEAVVPNLMTTRKGRTYNKEWVDALELENIVQLLEFAAESALLRQESRGVHFREDYPYTDNDNWLRESVVTRIDSGFDVSTRPVCTTSLTPPGGRTPYLDMIRNLMEAHSDLGGHP